MWDERGKLKDKGQIMGERREWVMVQGLGVWGKE